MHVHRTPNGGELSEIETTSIDNKKDKLKSYGQLLDEIFFGMSKFCPYNNDVPENIDPIFFVREKAVNSRGAMSEIGVFEVVGIADFWAYVKKNKTWHEIFPVTVKRLITGDCKADKTKVADYLKLYLGDIKFANDDESDAAAVAVSWLIQCGEIKNKLEKEMT